MVVSVCINILTSDRKMSILVQPEHVLPHRVPREQREKHARERPRHEFVHSHDGREDGRDVPLTGAQRVTAHRDVAHAQRHVGREHERRERDADPPVGPRDQKDASEREGSIQRAHTATK